MMKSNRKLSSLKHQATGTAALSFVFLGFGGWLWTVEMDTARMGAIILSVWGATGVFFAIKTYMRALGSNRHGWIDGRENK